MLAPPITHIFILAVVLRVGFFFFGLYQDEYLPVKYTDIDYLVFSDAANYVNQGLSPYKRETYRYTPLLAWLVLPNSWGGYWYSFGKGVFILGDLVTGWIIVQLLKGVRTKTNEPLTHNKISVLSSLWLLNPMVITISTRGSSESVLTVLIVISLYYIVAKRAVFLSAVWLGLAIHFKIYPVIYLPSILFYLAAVPWAGKPIVNLPVVRWLNSTNIAYLFVTVATVGVLNGIMYHFYGYEFLDNTYFYHLTRLDHRHNFSVYNIALYYKSALTESVSSWESLEKFAFIPQLLISAVFIPLVFAQKDLIASLFLQTFAFVTFNKVITSQYFIWFLIFLPQYLAKSKFLTKQNAWRGVLVLLSWILSQGTWLGFAYRLEFLGNNTLDSLLYSSVYFFLASCFTLTEFFDDVAEYV